MKLKFSVSVSGPLYSFARGEVGEIKDRDEAARLIKAGYASSVEKATKKKPTEKASK